MSVAEPPTACPVHLAYGHDRRLEQEKRRQLEGLAVVFQSRYGAPPDAVYRIPSRISLNPHSDHQGAFVPYGCHARETLLAVRYIPGDQVTLCNLDMRCEQHLSFSLAEETRRGDWQGGWLTYIESPEVRKTVLETADRRDSRSPRRGALNYVRASLLRLLKETEIRPHGLQMLVGGDIPQGSGLSSSSALVVGSALAFLGDHAPGITRERLAELCGEAEWYVGTRGGSGDHTAILFGRRGELTHACFRDVVKLHDLTQTPFPAGYQLLLANSCVRSRKSAEEKLMFNTGIFAYRFAYLALRARLAEIAPELLPLVSCLGDLTEENLSLDQLRTLVASLPVTISCEALQQQFPEQFETAAVSCFDSADLSALPDRIPLRGAAIYGLGRADRGRVMPRLLSKGTPEAMVEFGRLMTVTHDGDRRYRNGLAWQYDDSETGPDQPLREEPGFYGASIRELDDMVDLLLGAPGVLGAGLMGAGGGGYVIALVEERSTEMVREALASAYYGPRGFPPDAEPWHPADGAYQLL